MGKQAKDDTNMEIIIIGVGIFLVWKVIQTVFTLGTMTDEEKSEFAEKHKNRKKERAENPDYIENRENFESDMRAMDKWGD